MRRDGRQIYWKVESERARRCLYFVDKRRGRLCNGKPDGFVSLCAQHIDAEFERIARDYDKAFDNVVKYKGYLDALAKERRGRNKSAETAEDVLDEIILMRETSLPPSLSEDAANLVPPPRLRGRPFKQVDDDYTTTSSSLPRRGRTVLRSDLPDLSHLGGTVEEQREELESLRRILDGGAPRRGIWTTPPDQSSSASPAESGDEVR